MPVIITRGALSAKGYGFGGRAAAVVGPDGTFAIFALGNNGTTPLTTRNKYTYSGCVVSAGGAATAASSCGSAAGNSTVGIFALGTLSVPNNMSCRLTTRNKYTYSGCVVSAGTASTVASRSGSAAGNSTVGIFALGSIVGNTPAILRDKYTYSSDAVASGASATVASNAGAAAGNSTVGIFALGTTSNTCNGSGTTTRNKYTYSGCVVSAGTASTLGSVHGSATGNSTIGIFAIGATTYCCGYCRVATRNKYTYSGDVVSAGGAATNTSYAGSASGNSTVGIFALGTQCSTTRLTTRNKYTYSGCVVSAGGAATVASGYGSAAANGTSGVNT